MPLALANAVFYDSALISHIDEIDSLEKPAVMADFLLRFRALIQWAPGHGGAREQADSQPADQRARRCRLRI